MPLNTRQKIACARAASRVVRAGRGIIGLGPELVASRRGISWNLDLREGFEFSIYAFAGIELETMRAYQRLLKPGDFVLDIGANIGAHCLPMADLVGGAGRVYSFEASDHAFARQEANIALNPRLAPHIRANQALLVSDVSNAKPDGIPSSWPLEPSVGADIHPVHLGKYHSVSGARVMRLDDWLAEESPEKIDFVKIDVDGYEIDVLRGAKQTFAQHRPLMLMEFMPYIFPERGQKFADLLALLRAMDYRAEDLHGRKVALDASVERLIPTGGSINVVLHPA